MVKNHMSFYAFLLSLLFLSTTVICFGETSDALLQAKEQVDALIKSGDTVAAEAGISRMKSDFVDKPELPTRLFEIGRTYADNKDNARFRSMCGYIVSGYPQSSAAVSSNIYLSRYAVEDLIDQKNITEAEAGIAKMKVDFADHPDELSARLYQIGRKFANSGDNARFRSICQEIVAEFPESPMAAPAGMYLSRIAIEELIKMGDDVGAEAAIEKMKTDFADYPSFHDRLFEIGYKFHLKGDTSRFRSICQQIVTEYPGSSKIASLYLCRFSIEDLIEQGDVTGAESAISKMKTDFAGYKYLSDQLYKIGRTMCVRAKEMPEFRPLCQQLIAEYYPNNDKRIRLLAKLSSYDVLDSIKAGDMDAADQVISQVKDLLTDTNGRAFALYLVAEELYLQAKKLGADQQALAAKYYYQSIAYEGDVLPITSDANLKAKIYYVIGLNHKKLKEYPSALEAFTNSYKSDPKSYYADYCLFMQGYCTERLVDQGVVSQADAKPVITHYYQRVISEFPQSDYAVDAKQWLNATN